nr:RNA-directed DNA polymerase, eukaryota [Tanacetum cinerariifolium]
MTNSYAHVVKGNQVQNVGMEECPNMMLDETCLNHEDFSLCLLGKVKEFASLTNLKVVLEVPCWVPEFEEDGEEGYDVNDGSHEDDMYGGVSENLKDVEGESDKEEVPETNFEEENDVHSDDPFGIYEVLNKKNDGKNIDDKKMEYAWDNMFMSGWRFQMTHMSPHVLDILRSQKYLVKDYLLFVIGNWDGEVVIMGDFNKVRDISERFGSIFNKHGAEAFNSFILNAGLVEVPLGGCSFTWCHKSAKKMSKLNRFLISDNLMCSCPSISSTSLDRFLSDHRPIIMREVHYDYGPIPFKFFHYWFELDSFDKLVEQTWLEANARLHKESLNSRKSILKAELADLDRVIDKGEGSDADGHRRREVVRLIQEV